MNGSQLRDPLQASGKWGLQPPQISPVAEVGQTSENHCEDAAREAMKFSAKYEILKSLARGDVEAFAVRERTSGERLLAYIFPCSEPPEDQPISQWIQTSLAKLAPEAPGNTVEVGKYDVASFAYIVTSWPATDVLDAWVHQYQYKADVLAPSSSPDPGIAAEQPPGSRNAVSEAVPEPASGSSLPPADAHSTSDPFPGRDNSQGETLFGDFGSQPREPGDFTRQFFREVGARHEAVHLDGRVAASADATPANQPEHPAAPSASPGAAPRNDASMSPDVWSKQENSGLPTGFSTKLFEQSLSTNNAAPSGELGQSEPPRISSGEFTKWYGAHLEKEESGSAVEFRSSIGPRTETGEFSKMFGPEVPRAANEPSLQEPVFNQASGSLHGSSTEVLSNNSAAAERSPIGPRTETGEFLKMFGLEVPSAADKPDLQEPVVDRSPAPLHGSSTEILNHSSALRGDRFDSNYAFETKANAQNIDQSGSTHIFGDPKSRPDTVAPVTIPGWSSSEAVLSAHQVDGAAGGATVVFRQPAEINAVENDVGSSAGPSEYTRFMSREEIFTSALQSGDAIAPPANSSGGGAAGSAAAAALPFVTPPAVPSYPPPSPQFAGYPPAPAFPGGGAPGMPPVPPPPSMPAPGAKPSGGPKSYLPLIVTLNVLFIIAVLLIVYFALKH